MCLGDDDLLLAVGDTSLEGGGMLSERSSDVTAHLALRKLSDRSLQLKSATIIASPWEHCSRYHKSARNVASSSTLSHLGIIFTKFGNNLMNPLKVF